MYPFLSSGSVFVAIAARRKFIRVTLIASSAGVRPGALRMAIINFLVIAALVATVIVLALGLRSMARGGDYDRENAEKFMWERVALQAIVVILLLSATVLLNI